MGWGSSGPPPWIDEETKRKAKEDQDTKKIEALEKENKALKERVRRLEAEVKRLKKQPPSPAT